MFILKVYEEEIQCDKVVKGSDYIKVYFNGEQIRGDSGISDFSGYILADEDGNSAEFSKPELDEITQLQLAVTELYEGVMSHG